MGAVWAGFREVHLHRDSEILMFINALMMSITQFLKGLFPSPAARNAGVLS